MERRAVLLTSFAKVCLHFSPCPCLMPCFWHSQRCSANPLFTMLTADTGANSTTTADREQSMGSEGTDKQQTDAVIQQEVRTSTAALQAATAAPQTPLELAASVATAVPGPHHGPAQDQTSAGGPCIHMQSKSKAQPVSIT